MMTCPTVRLRAVPLAARMAVYAIAILLGTARAEAAPKWVLVYYRQLGNQINANSLTIENHVFHEDGHKMSGVGITNQSNSGTAIFGYTDYDGHNRLNPMDVNNCAYDITIYDPSVPNKDATPNFYWQNQQQSWPQFYSYVTHWMYVTDPTRLQAFPQTPVYHYDLVNGLNYASGFSGGCIPIGWVEAPGANSDARELPSGGWQTYQAQTFVVPQGINRIVSAMAFLIRGGDPPGPRFTYRASIHAGSPTGTQIGPSTTSREVHSSEFKEVAVSWGVDDVPVTPGQTYAIKFVATDGQGFNVFRTLADNYPNGHLYHGTISVPDRDMVAVVVGVGYDVDPPAIAVNPATLNPSVLEGGSPPSGSFTVSNAGAGTLYYSIADDATWLSVSPTQGDATVETDTITVNYNTAQLNDGLHTGHITVSSGNASNSPQTVTVNLTVTPSAYAPCDFEPDGDVDMADYGRFQSCYTGSGNAQTAPACQGARLDEDEDVDRFDFDRFTACMSGAGVPADPDCAE
jgi:hypothetical protein